MGIMSRGKNTLCFRIWNGYSHPPPSQINLKLFFFCDSRAKTMGGVPNPNQTLAVWCLAGGGGGVGRDLL